MTKLNERSVTVSLHLSMWAGKRQDSTTTREVLVEKTAAGDAGQFFKLLMPKGPLQAVAAAHNYARRKHYTMTQPWGADGIRILNSMLFMEYMEMMAEQRKLVEASHEQLYIAYEEYRPRAEAHLGKLYDATDFPTMTELRSKFGYELLILPSPSETDFRVTVPDPELEAQLRSEISATIRQQLVGAERALYQELIEELLGVIPTLQKPITRATGKLEKTLGRIQDLARLAPRRTLLDLPRFDSVCEQVVTWCGTKNLRNAAIRKQIRMNLEAQVQRLREMSKEL